MSEQTDSRASSTVVLYIANSVNGCGINWLNSENNQARKSHCAIVLEG